MATNQMTAEEFEASNAIDWNNQHGPDRYDIANLASEMLFDLRPYFEELLDDRDEDGLDLITIHRTAALIERCEEAAELDS